MNKKYFINKTNTTVGIYDIDVTVAPGAVFSLLNSQIEKSANLNQFLDKGIIAEAEMNTSPLIFKRSSGPDVVLPAGVVPEKRTIVDGATKREASDSGSIVQKSESGLPGTGTVKSTEQVIADGAQQIKDVLDNTIAVVAPASPEPALVPAQIPANLTTWMTYSLNIKKSQIVRYSDIGFLMHIAKFDTDPKVKKLVNQRIKELQGFEEAPAPDQPAATETK